METLTTKQTVARVLEKVRAHYLPYLKELKHLREENYRLAAELRKERETVRALSYQIAGIAKDTRE